jgi:hypothetical protein
MRETYEKPVLRDVGTLEELTQQQFNKIGTTPDVLTAVNENVVGSFSPI